VQWLPPGFTPLQTPGESRVLSYSDGLAVLSIFVEPEPESAARVEGQARQGATSAYSRTLRAPGRRSYVVTVLGEVPRATVAKVAAAVTWPDPQP
jgi:sigma-E factor negative regulatory protein RseB